MKAQNEMGWPLRIAIPSTTTFALAPIAVAFPPRSAPRASAHHSGWPGLAAGLHEVVRQRGEGRDVGDVVDDAGEHRGADSSPVAAPK